MVPESTFFVEIIKRNQGLKIEAIAPINLKTMAFLAMRTLIYKKFFKVPILLLGTIRLPKK